MEKSLCTIDNRRFCLLNLFSIVVHKATKGRQKNEYLLVYSQHYHEHFVELFYIIERRIKRLQIYGFKSNQLF